MTTEHKIIFGDSRDMRKIQSGSVDLMITSPPYPMIEMWDEMFTEQNFEIGNALKANDGNLAFELMNKELDKVWDEACGEDKLRKHDHKSATAHSPSPLSPSVQSWSMVQFTCTLCRSAPLPRAPRRAPAAGSRCRRVLLCRRPLRIPHGGARARRAEALPRFRPAAARS